MRLSVKYILPIFFPYSSLFNFFSICAAVRALRFRLVGPPAFPLFIACSICWVYKTKRASWCFRNLLRILALWCELFDTRSRNYLDLWDFCWTRTCIKKTYFIALWGLAAAVFAVVCVVTAESKKLFLFCFYPFFVHSSDSRCCWVIFLIAGLFNEFLYLMNEQHFSCCFLLCVCVCIFCLFCCVLCSGALLVYEFLFASVCQLIGNISFHVFQFGKTKKQKCAVVGKTKAKGGCSSNLSETKSPPDLESRRQSAFERWHMSAQVRSPVLFRS